MTQIASGNNAMEWNDVDDGMRVVSCKLGECIKR